MSSLSNPVLVVGYANHQNLYSKNWERSLKNSGLPFKLIGVGEKWTGWGTRIDGYLEFLKSEKSSSTVYLLVDVYDVLAVGTEKELLSKWAKFKTPIVIGAEPNCNPSLCRPLQNYWNDESEENRYLNFGLVAGTRLPLIDFFSWLKTDSKKYSSNIWNEQISASKYIDSHPNQVTLDTNSELIGNIICHPKYGNINKFKWESFVSDGKDPFVGRGRVIYKSRTYPIFIHTPSKGIDAHRRYRIYGELILGDKWRPPTTEIITTPGYHWVWIAILVVLIILLFVFGLRDWILVGLALVILILIFYFYN
jgi:hypothetical protein